VFRSHSVVALLLPLACLLGCAETSPVALERAPSAPDTRAACTAARQRFRVELAAAGEGCLSDDGCAPFDTCHAVVRDHGAAVAQLRGEMRETCKASSEGPVELECTPRPVRCVARRCLRY
jgi:hypothetical protein